MPRRSAAALVDQEIPGLDSLEQDPAPRAARGRPRKTAAKAAGNRGKIPVRTASGRVMSKAAMQAKVRDEALLYLTLSQAAWEMRDPVCAATATPERLEMFADRVVAMVSRSESMLQMAASTGILGEIAMALNAVFPILKTLWVHHGPGGKGHDHEEAFDATQYPAYAPG